MNNLKISVLKETRNGEKRVILTPCDVSRLVRAGYEVVVEDDAGCLSGYPNDKYMSAGANIADRDAAWSSKLILKYKAPDSSEYGFFRDDMHLACYMHAEGNLALTEAMRSSGMTAYALEFFKTKHNEYPAPVSDNEISGKLAILMAAYYLQSHMGGSGVLLSNVSGAPKAKVVVIGYGNAGGAAAHLAASMGASVSVFGTRWEGIRRFNATAPSNVLCYINEKALLEEKIIEADVVVGAILISTHDTPPMLNESTVRRMKPGSVIVDVTCGYGSGYMPTFNELTTHDKPFYKRFGVQHCKIDAMPASVPITATRATSANVWRYLLALANDVFHDMKDIVSRNGCLLSGGKIIHPELVRHLSMGQ